MRYNPVVPARLPCIRILVVALAMTAVTATASAAVTTSMQPPAGEGVLVVASDGDDLGRRLIADSTRVTARIVGFAAQVRVRQAFNNPLSTPLEAIYIFPLPAGAAIGELRVAIGERRIKSAIFEREKARALFAEARKGGTTAALLEQERPNVFTQSVTQIPSGATVDIEIVYDLPLSYQDGGFEFVYPMVVGPRYIPGVATGKPPVGHGTGPDTDQVPDGSRITPPVLPAERSGRNVRLQVSIDPGKPIAHIDSPTHEIAVTRHPRETTVDIELVGKDRLANKDFVLHYRLADTSPVATMMAHGEPGKPGGVFALMLEPPPIPKARAAEPLELVFVIDSSSSMVGLPLDLAKRATRHALAQLRPGDRFGLVSFADGRVAERDLATASASEIEKGRAWIDGLNAVGEGDIAGGMAHALAAAGPAQGMRIVCLVSDGLVGNERAVMALAERTLPANTRVFALGIGAAVNRHLIEGLAQAGRGHAEVVLTRSSKPRGLEKQVESFVDRLRKPVLVDLTIDWGDLKVDDQWPSALPDLFAGLPVTVVGRYRKTGDAAVTLRGKSGGQVVEYEVPLTIMSRLGDHEALPRLWARRKIAELERQQLTRDNEQLTAEIVKLGTEYGLVTRFTSFVAVDERPAAGGGTLRTYVVPALQPEGVARGGERVQTRAEATGAAADAAGTVDEQEATEAEAMSAPMDMAASEAVGRWTTRVGLGLGDFIPTRDSHYFIASLSLRVERGLTNQLVAGVRTGLLVAASRKAPSLIAGLIYDFNFEAGWRAIGGAPLGLRLGTGLSLFGGTGGVSSAASLLLGTRIPIELRYQHIFAEGNDLDAITLGITF